LEMRRFCDPFREDAIWEILWHLHEMPLNTTHCKSDYLAYICFNSTPQSYYAMKTKNAPIFFLLLIVTLTKAQQPVFNIDFSLSNGAGQLQDYSIKRTNDNGSISFQSFITPNTTVPTYSIYVKRDSLGAQQWSKRLDYNSLACQYGSFMPCAFNGYMELTTGYVPNSLGSSFYKATRIDTSGNFLWSKTYVPAASIPGVSYGPKIRQNPDGGYLIANNVVTYPNNQYGYGLHAMRTDSAGNLLWSNLYLQEARSLGTWDMDLCSNGDVLICAGRKEPDCTTFIVVIRIDPSGNLIWGKEYYWPPTSSLLASHIKETANQEIMIAGNYGSSGNMLMRLDANGQVIWSRAYSNCFYAKQMVLTNDGGVIIVTNGVNSSNIYTVILKTDGAGNVLWSKRYDQIEEPRIDLTASGGLLICGQKNFSQVVFQTDSLGDSNCPNLPNTITSTPLTYTVYNVSSQTPMSMITYETSSTINPITITDAVSCLPTGVAMSEAANELLSIYPNPASDQILFENLPDDCNLSVYNQAGQLVYTGYPVGKRLDVHNWAQGLYLFQISSDGQVSSRKILIQR
jgi:Secretion system C-terminal sorting domain